MILSQLVRRNCLITTCSLSSEEQICGTTRGSTVVNVADLDFLGGSASAAGSLVEKLGGQLLGYIFILELDFLKGREKLQAPVYTLLSSQENSSTAP